MFTPLIRFTLLILCIIVSIIAALSGAIYVLILASFAALALLWGYYNVGTVYLALHKLRKGKYDDALAIWELTRKPEKLNKTRKAYYYYIKAYVAREKDDYGTAKNLFNLALSEGLKEEHDQAIALLALADIELINGNKKEAKRIFEKIKGLKVKPQLMPQVRQMQEYLGDIFM